MSQFDPYDNPYAAPSAAPPHVVDASAYQALEQRILGPMDLLQLAFRVFATKPLLIIGIVLAIDLPLNILGHYLDAGKEVSLQNTMQSIRMSLWLDSLFGVISTLGLAKITEVVVRGQSVTEGEFAGHVVRRLPSGIGTRLMFSIACGFLTCLLILPGIAFAVFWSFTDQFVSLRGIGGIDAMKSSSRLVSGRWWQVFGTMLAIGFLIFIVAMSISAMGGFALGIAGPPEVVESVISIAIDTGVDLIYALMPIAVTLYFLNLEHHPSFEGHLRAP